MATSFESVATAPKSLAARLEPMGVVLGGLTRTGVPPLFLPAALIVGVLATLSFPGAAALLVEVFPFGVPLGIAFGVGSAAGRPPACP